MVGESLNIRLLGPPLITVGGEPLPRLRSRKSLHLLALLALKTGAAIERDFLIGTLWPDSNQSAGQESLKKTLADLRTALGSEGERLCTPGRGQLRLDLSEGVFCDVLTFDLAMARFAKTGDPAVAEGAVALYRGPLLEGTDEDWVLGERALRERSALEALTVLGRRARDQKENPKALTLLRRAERIDPLSESVQRELIQTLAASGDINAARRAFRDLRLRLHEALRQEPSAETRALMQRLSETPPPNSEATTGGAESFPRFATPLIGREAERAAVQERLERGPLTTLVGIGGMGKTRLATALARTRARAVFVDLALLPAGSDTDTVARTIAQALGQSGVARLRNLLACDEALVVLDNCEHVIDGVRNALRLYLPDEATVRILATSREPLGLRGEQVVYLETLEPERAAELFRARAQDAGATLTENEETAIARICARLDGLPLALELAAARCGSLSPQELLQRLDEPLRVLSTRQPDLPERQRTMRATLDGSWATLSEEEQNACAALSVFVAPFTIDDAAALIGADEALDTVLTLHARSLLSARFGGWTFLQPVRVYATEKLTEHPEREAAAYRQHAEHLARLSERERARHYSDGRQQAFRRMIATRQDRDAALAWASSHDPALFVRLAVAQASLLRDLRFTEDAQALIRTTWELTTDSDTRAKLKLEEALSMAHGQRAILEEAIALAQLPATRGPILFEAACLLSTDQQSEAIQFFESCLADCIDGGNLYLAGFAAVRLTRLVPPGAVETRERIEQAFQKTLTHTEEVRQAARRTADRETEATALRTLGNLRYALGQKEESVLPLQRVEEIWREAGNQERTSDSLRAQGHQWAQIGHRDEAVRTYNAGFALYASFANASREERVLARCHAAFEVSTQGWFGVMRYWMDECLPYLASCSPAIQAPALYHLSMAYHYAGSGQQSQEYIRRCRDLRLQMGDEKDRQRAERMLAFTMTELGELAEARILLERLHVLHTRQDEASSRCAVLTLLARVARKSADWEECHTYLAEADALYPKAGSFYWDRRRLEGAMAYRAQGNGELARQELEKYWQAPTPFTRLEARLTGAWLDLEEGLVDNALRAFSAIREEALSNENLLALADAENGLAEAARQQGRDSDSAEHAQEATRLWVILDRPPP